MKKFPTFVISKLKKLLTIKKLSYEKVSIKFSSKKD